MTCYTAVILVLVIYSVDPLVSSDNLMRKSKADISTLELVQIVSYTTYIEICMD